MFPLTALRHMLGALWHATLRSTENTQESTFGASYDLHLDHIRQDVPALFKMFQNGKHDRFQKEKKTGSYGYRENQGK